jgi:hypothetical protein
MLRRFQIPSRPEHILEFHTWPLSTFASLYIHVHVIFISSTFFYFIPDPSRRHRGHQSFLLFSSSSKHKTLKCHPAWCLESYPKSIISSFTNPYSSYHHGQQPPAHCLSPPFLSPSRPNGQLSPSPEFGFGILLPPSRSLHLGQSCSSPYSRRYGSQDGRRSYPPHATPSHYPLLRRLRL